jgi:DNA-binding CsgD family transcriptional regulator
MLRAFERTVGFAEGVVMAFDPDVLLSTAFGLEPGSAWLDENGSVVFASPAARQWLELLGAQSHAGFARALLAGLAMRAARGAGHEGSGGPGRDAAEAGGAIAVRVRTAGDDGCGPGPSRSPRAPGVRGVVVAIDAAQPGSLLPLAAGAYLLTGREVEVVRGVLNGLDTRSVAARLHITEYTVQDHLKSVFDKADVRSRRQLAHLLAVQLR